MNTQKKHTTQALSLGSLPLVVETFLARSERQEHPDGTFDRKGRWYPAETERQDCCGDIRTPSAAYPYSYMTHCRTLKHVQHLLGVAPEQWVRRVRGNRLVAAVLGVARGETNGHN